MLGLPVKFNFAFNCCVSSDHIVFPKSGKPLRLVNGQFIKAKGQTSFSTLRHRISHRFSRAETIFAPEAALVSAPNAKNYAHFVRETFPILFALNNCNFPIPIVLGETPISRGFVGEYASTLKNLQFINLADGQNLFVEKLHYAANLRSLIDLERGNGSELVQQSGAFLRKAFGAEDTDMQGKERLYISRENSRRKIMNEKNVIQVLEQFGFQTVYTEGMSVAEQVRRFAQAEAVFAPHGAGLANVIAMKQGSVIVEASYPMPSRQDRNFFKFSHLLGHDHYLLQSIRSDFNRALSRHEDFVVDPQELRNLLTKVLYFDDPRAMRDEYVALRA